MEALLLIFAKHPLTPRTSGHSHAQVLVEADLKGLLSATLESMEDKGSHGDGRLGAIEGVLWFV
jgi:hypothetical protein